MLLHWNKAELEETALVLAAHEPIAAEASAGPPSEHAQFFDFVIPYDVYDAPVSAPASIYFIYDMLEQILLFVPLRPLKDLLCISLVSRRWAFFANHLPHAYRVDVSSVFDRSVIVPPARLVFRESAQCTAPSVSDTRQELVDSVDEWKRSAPSFCTSRCFSVQQWH